MRNPHRAKQGKRCQKICFALGKVAQIKQDAQVLLYTFIGHAAVFPVADMGGALRGRDPFAGFQCVQKDRGGFAIDPQVLCDQTDGHGVVVYLFH